ncbi:FAD-dependent oxidoreductase [Chloroflexota bacterium]
MMKLFEPGRIGKLSVKNRIVMAAMSNKLMELDGRLSQRGIDFYTARAKGGTGLILTGAARVSRYIEQYSFTPLISEVMLDNKAYAGPLGELAEAIHDHGAKVAIQISAGQGRTIRAEVLRSAGAVAPSPLPASSDPSIMARELTIEEIERLVEAFGFAAEVVSTAGIDAIELNCHGGYIFDQFQTSLWNKRTDKYGGDLDGRLRFLLEVIEAIKKVAGADFPVIVKYGLTHYLEGGREIDEGLEIARRLEAAGVDALDIDAGCSETRYWYVPPTTQPPGCTVDLAEEVKKVVNIPVIAVGRLGYPELAERVLQEGKADFIALGRGLLADPEWATKVKQGRVEDICPCIGDNEGCHSRIHAGMYISCTVNPACGMERELAIIPADKKKTVLVVGGGPGGMEAARIAVLRGHKVTLCEKDYALGGNLIPASVPDFKHDYRILINYLSTQIEKLGVEVKLATEATPELIQEIKPEVVFVATGGTPITPEIPGVDKEKVVTAVDVLLGRKEARGIVVVLGGGLVGCETALHLAQKGKRLTIAAASDRVMRDMAVSNRMHLLKLLADANVRILTGANPLEITDEGVTLADKDGRRSTLEADTIVLAKGFEPNRGLLEALTDNVPEVYAIGDCVAPRKVLDAIREGFRLARLI